MRFSSKEPSDEEILRAAASIHSRMRKAHRGGRPRRKHACPWCGAEYLGLHALREHQRSCNQSPGAALCEFLGITSTGPLLD